jgi:hypothetical protein
MEVAHVCAFFPRRHCSAILMAWATGNRPERYAVCLATGLVIDGVIEIGAIGTGN